MKRKLRRSASLAFSLLFASMLVSCGETSTTSAVDSLKTIKGVSLDDNGNIIVTYSDGTSETLVNVKGKDGKDGSNGSNGKNGENGISITDTSIDERGHLIVTLSDGTTLDAGEVKEPKKLYLNKSAEFDTGYTSEDGGVAEIVKFNKDNSKAYLVNGKTKTLDIVSLTLQSQNKLKKE